MSQAGSEANYRGATHWSAILDNVRSAIFKRGLADEIQIRDIQGFLRPALEPHADIAETTVIDSPDVMFQFTKIPTIEDVCNSLPPRPTVDRLVSLYFNGGNFKLRE